MNKQSLEGDKLSEEEILKDFMRKEDYRYKSFRESCRESNFFKLHLATIRLGEALEKLIEKAPWHLRLRYRISNFFNNLRVRLIFISIFPVLL